MMEASVSYNNKNKSIDWLKNISMLLLALLPIIVWYKVSFPMGLGYALVLPLALFTIAKYSFKLNVVPVSFWIVFLYVSFMWMCNNSFGMWTLLPPGGWVFFSFVVAILWGVLAFDLRLLEKYMRWIIIISGILFWIQLLLVITTGSPQICFVPNLTGAFIYQDYTYSDIVAVHLIGNPCSIFLEKSYLAYYFLTYLTLIWFKGEKNDRLFSKEIIFVIATLIASRSGTALIGLSVIIVAKLFYMFWSTSANKRVMLIFCTIPLFACATYGYINSEMGQLMLNRSDEFSTEGTSGFTRVMGGYIMFESMSSEEKTFGIKDAKSRFGEMTSDGKLNFFANGIQTILINLGYVGLILYLSFYISVFRKCSLTSKMSLVILLIMGLLESNYLNPYMMLLTITPCADYYIIKRKATSK